MSREGSGGEQAALAPERSASVDAGPALRRPSTAAGRVDAGRRVSGVTTSKSGPLSKPSTVGPTSSTRQDPKARPGAVASPGRAAERGSQGLSQRLKELAAPRGALPPLDQPTPQAVPG